MCWLVAQMQGNVPSQEEVLPMPDLLDSTILSQVLAAEGSSIA